MKRLGALVALLLFARLPLHAAQTAVSPGLPARLRLSLKEAEDLALRSNPQMSVARLNALAADEVTRETRSALLPSGAIYATAADAHENSAISAGGLTNPTIYERVATGAAVSQLITDFGRTTNLLSSARLRAHAEEQNSKATMAQIILAVDQAFFRALQSQALLKVAEETVRARQVVVDQVGALARSQLKSTLDLSFAKVNLAEARLLLLDAQNGVNAGMAALSEVLGYPTQETFELVEEETPFLPPPADVESLIARARERRPEVLALDLDYQAAEKFRRAEHDLLRPSVRAVGAVGVAPIRNQHLSQWYGAVGVNVEIPVFNNFLFVPRAREADLRAAAAEQRMVEVRNRVSRDVRTSWLDANTAYSRLDVTRQFLDQASQALDLAETRYGLGLGSIVELSQAQLRKTQAEISDVAAGYQYRLALATLEYQVAGH
ncbi:MAG TPA: TolC family protein [Vicinamibacteria bacterium]|nr:TolC family protein [Vicinamibacteria bacterium]